ncbi:hypothetical protein EDD85DRAFT_797444 [Armillaria nabsnona]|nr:hypothetical protein EDD85DRAFT_797444 [Armillaria nabsnona]
MSNSFIVRTSLSHTVNAASSWPDVSFWSAYHYQPVLLEGICHIQWTSAWKSGKGRCIGPTRTLPKILSLPLSTPLLRHGLCSSSPPPSSLYTSSITSPKSPLPSLYHSLSPRERRFWTEGVWGNGTRFLLSAGLDANSQIVIVVVFLSGRRIDENGLPIFDLAILALNMIHTSLPRRTTGTGLLMILEDMTRWNCRGLRSVLMAVNRLKLLVDMHLWFTLAEYCRNRLEASLSLVRAIADVNSNIIRQVFDNVPTRKGLPEGGAFIVVKASASATDVVSDNAPTLTDHPPSIS